MDLQQIKYFLAVVDSGTFLAASRNVHVSQPTLSAGIKKLEESLNVTLFNRGSRSATLTPAGEQFLIPARQAFNQLQTIRAKLSDQPDRMIIGVLTNIHMDHVAQIIGSYRATHPHILIELVVADSEELEQMLRAQEVDLIITNSDVSNDNNQVNNFVPLFAEQLCLVVPNTHPLAKEKSIELSALSGELFIERVHCSFWNEVNQVFQQQNITPHTVMQADNDEFVLSLVSANLGVSIITDRTTPYQVSFIPIRDIDIERSIGVCLSASPANVNAQGFYDALISHYSS